ncbi:MAG TPA: hypothetical protein VNK43_05240 [Gemmatimonadales bacterium]|nr:hypothetical protein [Gemmatimonadales bacterium]
MHPYAPRPIRFHGVRAAADWRIKLYSITHDGSELDWSDFEAGLRLAWAELPQPAVTLERPGLGFLVAHRGRTAHYLVLGWWDRENELPVRVFVRDVEEGGDPAAWRPARGGESFCVWDLQVLWFEREAYVATLLSPDAPSDAAARYLGRCLTWPPGGVGERVIEAVPGAR